MSEPSFFVSHSGRKSEGPFTAQELKKKLKSGDLLYTDYLWVPELDEWCMLAQHFSGDFPPPKEPPPGITVSEKKIQEREYRAETFSQDLGISNEPIWFLYRDNTKFGPYRYLELVRLLRRTPVLPTTSYGSPASRTGLAFAIAPNSKTAC